MQGFAKVTGPGMVELLPAPVSCQPIPASVSVGTNSWEGGQQMTALLGASSEGAPSEGAPTQGDFWVGP